MQSTVEPSGSPRKPLVGVISHLVSGQGRRLSWEKILETLGLRAGSGLGEMGEWPARDAYSQECAGGAGSGHRGASAPAASESPAQSGFCGRPGSTLCQLFEHTYHSLPLCLCLARLQGRRQHPLAFDLPDYLNYWRLGGFCPEV